MNIKHQLNQYKEKINDLPTFLSKLSVLMKEGYKLSDAISMLLPYYSAAPQKWEQKIKECLQNGLNASEIFRQLNVDKEFLITLHFADQHGNLAQSLHQISEQMSYKEKVKKQLMKILAYPIMMFFMLVIFFIGFRIYFLPNMERIISSRGNDGGSSMWLSEMLLRMPDFFIIVATLIIIGIALAKIYLKKRSVEAQLNILMKIPIIRKFYKMQLTRQFARNLGNLLTTGFSLQQALYELKSQTFKRDVQYVATKLEERVLFGDSLTQSVQLYPYFSQKFDVFVNHGENSGLLGRELILYCDMLDEKLKQSLSKLFSYIQPTLFIIIAVCIVSAYLSILLPVYKMIEIV